MKKIAAFLIIAMLLSVAAAAATGINLDAVFESDLGFTGGLEEQIAENIPFKDELSALMTGIRYASGVRYFDGTYIGNDGSLIRDIESPSSRTVALTKNYVLSFAEEHHCGTYFMLIPTAAVIRQQEIASYAAENIYNQRHLINEMYSEFYGTLSTVDVYQALFNRRSEYIYYHTEDLPTNLGGFYIYQELAARLNLRPKTLKEFSSAYAAHNFYGSLAEEKIKPYAASDFMSLYDYVGEQKSFTVTHFYNDGTEYTSEGLYSYDEEKFEDKTDMVFGGLSPVMEINSGDEEGGTLLVFGDEAAKSWLSFLAVHYGKITFVDLNSASEGLLSEISVYDYDQALFAYSVGTFASGIDFGKLDSLS